MTLDFNPSATAAETVSDDWNGPEHRSPFWQWVGLTSKKLDDGLVELHFDVQPQMINLGNGSLHGGMTAAIIDSAVAAAINSVFKRGELKGMTTIDLNVTYLEAVKPNSHLVCRCKLERKGGTICVGNAEVRDQNDRLCAVGRATYMVFRNKDEQKPNPA